MRLECTSENWTVVYELQDCKVTRIDRNQNVNLPQHKPHSLSPTKILSNRREPRLEPHECESALWLTQSREPRRPDGTEITAKH